MQAEIGAHIARAMGGEQGSRRSRRHRSLRAAFHGSDARGTGTGSGQRGCAARRARAFDPGCAPRPGADRSDDRRAAHPRRWDGSGCAACCLESRPIRCHTLRRGRRGLGHVGCDRLLARRNTLSWGRSLAAARCDERSHQTGYRSKTTHALTWRRPARPGHNISSRAKGLRRAARPGAVSRRTPRGYRPTRTPARPYRRRRRAWPPRARSSYRARTRS